MIIRERPGCCATLRMLSMHTTDRLEACGRATGFYRNITSPHHLSFCRVDQGLRVPRTIAGLVVRGGVAAAGLRATLPLWVWAVVEHTTVKRLSRARVRGTEGTCRMMLFHAALCSGRLLCRNPSGVQASMFHGPVVVIRHVQRAFMANTVAGIAACPSGSNGS